MRIVTNQRLAKRNRQIAFWLMIGTLGVLVGSFLLMMQNPIEGNPEISALVLLFQVLVLPVAFVLTLVSVRMTNLWARPPRPEDAIEEGLKGLSNKSVLYNYYHFPARHVLICPQGVFAIVTRWHNGSYTVQGERWKTNQGIFSRLGSLIRAVVDDTDNGLDEENAKRNECIANSGEVRWSEACYLLHRVIDAEVDGITPSAKVIGR